MHCLAEFTQPLAADAVSKCESEQQKCDYINQNFLETNKIYDKLFTQQIISCFAAQQLFLLTFQAFTYKLMYLSSLAFTFSIKFTKA